MLLVLLLACWQLPLTKIPRAVACSSKGAGERAWLGMERGGVAGALRRSLCGWSLRSGAGTPAHGPRAIHAPYTALLPPQLCQKDFLAWPP
eukprot:gene14676-biopygen17117